MCNVIIVLYMLHEFVHLHENYRNYYCNFSTIYTYIIRDKCTIFCKNTQS